MGAGLTLVVVAMGLSSAPAMALPSEALQRPISVSVSKDNVAPLRGAGFLAQIDDEWFVDGPKVAAAAAGLRAVNSSPVGYDRSLFAHWSDLDGNGCDARNDVLQRDLSEVLLEAGSTCVVDRGTLHDPHSGAVIPFVRGVATSGAVHVDHIVPLAAAWTGGASDWDAGQREAFANDPRNLQAMDGLLNSEKGARLPSEWMPPNTAFHCLYLAQLTGVLAAYNLAVTPMDQDAIINGGTIDGVDFAGVNACVLPPRTADNSSEQAPPPASAPAGTIFDDPASIVALAIVGLVIAAAASAIYLVASARSRNENP